MAVFTGIRIFMLYCQCQCPERYELAIILDDSNLKGVGVHGRQESSAAILFRLYLTILLCRGAVQSGQTGKRIRY